jgi:hypothetical protein
MSKETNRKGRRLDGTPNKVFTVKLIEKHDDNTGTYETTFNDADGVRHVETERIPLKKRGGGGRGVDLTPNREFTPRRSDENPDGTVTYVIPYNDENGVRHERTEIREKGQRGGHRQPDATPNKIISGVKTERVAVQGADGVGGGTDAVMTIPYNDKEGNRFEGYVVLSVNSKGNLTAKVVQDKPEVFIRQRKAGEAAPAPTATIEETAPAV